MRRDPRDHTQARKEVGHSAAVVTFQRLQGRWAVKDSGGENLQCLTLQTNSEGECYGNEETKPKQLTPAVQRSPGASGLFFHSCCTPQARKKIHQEAAAFISAPQEHPQMSFLL